MTTETIKGYKLTGERDDLLASFQTAERFVAKIGSNPAVTGIRVLWSEDGGYVEATNLNTSVRTHLWGSMAADEVVDLIVSPRIVKALQSLPAGEATVSFDGGVCEVRGKGKGRYQVGILSGSWPNVDTGAGFGWDETPILDASEVMEAMGVAAKFASRNESQPTITGVNVRADGDKVRVAATDNHRLFTTRVDPNEFWQNDEDVTVPHAMIADITRLFPDGEIKLHASDNLLFVTAPEGGTYFACRRLGGKFPPIEKLFPAVEEYQWDVGIPRADLKEALKRISFMADKKPIKLQIEDDELRLTAHTDTGMAEEYVDLPFEHAKLQIGFNLEQLSSVVEIFDGDEIRFRFISPLRPALVTANDEEPEALLMPVRVV